MKGFHLDLYDIKRGTSINLKDHANRISYSATTFVYVESLVPPNSGANVGLPEIEESRGSPASPESVNESRETSPQKSCEMYDKYNRYVETYMDLKRRKLDLETRKIDFKHMSMDTSNMNALRLKWWQVCANRVAKGV
ncbi:hypothetical protein MKW92_025319 [Papaver armeniacum]|nr:hypothetical protein MKW92_025319 [Papaver armeniacum]